MEVEKCQCIHSVVEEVQRHFTKKFYVLFMQPKFKLIVLNLDNLAVFSTEDLENNFLYAQLQ